VRKWPSEVYNSRNVIEAVHDALLRNIDSLILMETLYLLYTNSSQHGLQFYFGLKLRIVDEDLFELVKQHNLFAFIAGSGLQDAYSRISAERIPLLFEYDEWVVELEWKGLMEDEAPSPNSLVSVGTKKHKSPSIWKIRRATEMAGVSLLASSTDRIPVCHFINTLDPSCR
jgi:hypothetical protein